jgi:sphingomyelin phosphodiesterase
MLPYIGAINNNSERAEAIGEVIFNMDYDIIVFQEAFSNNSRELILKELDSKYQYVYGPVNEEKKYWVTNSGIWVLSKIPLQFIKSIEFNDSKGFDAVANKGAVVYEGNWNGKIFQLVGTHLQANEYSYIRKRQINQLNNEILLPHKKDSVPQLICGDFNINTEDFFDYFYLINCLKVKNERYFSLENISYDEINNKLAEKDKPVPKTLDYILIGNETINFAIEKNIKRLYGFSSDGLKVDLSDHYAIEGVVSF